MIYNLKTKIFLVTTALAAMVSVESFSMAPVSTAISRNSHRMSRISSSSLAMSDDADAAAPKPKKTRAPVDLSGFSEGQKLEGKLLSVKAFGAFVEVPGGANVLLPRSVISRGSYSKLTKMAESKSTDPIHVEIVSVDTEKNTLSGKYIPAGVTEVLNIEDLQAQGAEIYQAKQLQATVVGVHDFGVFAELDEYGAEGLIPMSRLPEGEVPQSYVVGSTVTVGIEEMNQEKKKMTLTMKSAGTGGGAAASSGGAGDSLPGVPPNKWMQGVVTSVSNFGLFVRPAGQDVIGLIHVSRIPAKLLSILKQTANPSPDGEKSDVELLFQAGDVVKCRLNMYTASTKKLELSMMPAKNDGDQDDGYIVEGRDPEGEENKPQTNEQTDEIDFDPEETLLWWKGAPYQKRTGEVDADTLMATEEAGVTQESSAIVEGTWRRMFEIDLRKDMSDASAKQVEQETKALNEEIGELNGLDEMLTEDSFGMGVSFNNKQLGASVPLEGLPEAWVKELSFFKESTSFQDESTAVLKGGKKNEQAEFEKLLREVEIELDAVSPRRSKPAPPIDTVPEVANTAVADEAPPAEASASTEDAAPETADVE